MALVIGDRLVIASHNPGKVREIGDLIRPLGIEAVSAGDLGLDEPEETGSTFTANAMLKSEAAAKASGLPALADDSGLSVDALDGAPGLRSARYSGGGDEANNALLLQNMAALEGVDRAAFYIAVVVLLRH
ncbi:MAG: non-canonical purine NTP pyrophosphatase, partial [Alphaproteobacteria bacterium]